MQTAELDYDLPEEAIAQVAAEPRDSARLLIDRGAGQPPRDGTVADLPSLVGRGDLLVVNTTRVFPARLHGRRTRGGGAEVLLLERRADGTWAALVRPSRRLRPGDHIHVAPDLAVEVGAVLPEGMRSVRLECADETAAIEAHGAVALPPYITAELPDPERYQTVYAKRPVSVAAPTAGLHLTESLLGEVRAAGAEVAEIELAVGAGTFRPITAAELGDHRMHEEWYHVPPEVLERCRAAERVIAIGTTTVRALESAVRTGEEGPTRLFITPGFEFEVVDALWTNFHQPRSSLLALLAAAIGPRWRELYEHALTSGYRFLSLGDAMFVPRFDNAS